MGGGEWQSSLSCSSGQFESIGVAGNTGGACQQRTGLCLPELSRYLHQVIPGQVLTGVLSDIFFQSQELSKGSFETVIETLKCDSFVQWIFHHTNKLKTYKPVDNGAAVNMYNKNIKTL